MRYQTKKTMQFWLLAVRNSLQGAWRRIRFGAITEHVVGTAGHGVVAEVEYRGRGNKVVGYWAYGYFHPAYPYQGK